VAPELPRGLLLWEIAESWPVAARRLGCVTLHVHHEKITPQAVAAAKGMGLGVAVYTVNDPARAQGLVGSGVDAVISDRPELMLEALSATPSAAPSAEAGVAVPHGAAYIGQPEAKQPIGNPAGRS